MDKMKQWIVRAFKGFTLIELLVVVIIIGILAALAIPQYTKTIERAHWAEAIDNLGQLRAAEIRYFAENDAYTPGTGCSVGGGSCTPCPSGSDCDFSALDITDPNDISNAYYDYNLTEASWDDQTFTLRATRRTGKYKGAYIELEEGGTWDKDQMYTPDDGYTAVTH